MKKEEKTELTKNKIIVAAIQEFGLNGYKGASLNRICSRGISKGLLYHNYKSRDDVYIACVKKCFLDLLCAFGENQNEYSMEEYMSVRMRFFEEHPMESHIIFESMIQKEEGIKDRIKEAQKEFNDFNIIYFKQILSKTSLRENISEEDAIRYFSLVQAMFNLYFSSNTCETVSVSQRAAKHEERLPKIFDLILYGIAERRAE